MNVVLPEDVLRQKILVVDDNPAGLYATTRVLRSVGFDVLEAATGAGALRAAVGDDIGLLILDINLPDMDGFEVCRKLRERGNTAYLPIVHLSATATSEADMAQGLAAGADSYLTHPVDSAVLVATVRALLFARRADINRRAVDARFRTVFELASSGIALLDHDLVYTDVNPAFCRIAGRPREDIVGHPGPSLIAPGHDDEIATIKAHLEITGGWSGTMPVLRGDSSVAEVEWRIVREAQSGARIAIATDVTERRRAEAERERLLASERAARADAERSNRIKDEFLATLSHELRNPLNAILGWAAVLRHAPGTSPMLAQGIEAIERNSRLQAHLIADLLDFAGIRFGKMRIDLEAIDPAGPIKAALDVVASLAKTKSIDVQWNISNRGVRVLADESRLQQIIWNLLTNAIKFTPNGGRISLTTGSADGAYEITVTDTGRGISADFLPHVFDRFRQQDKGNAKSYSGLGIGLSIVKHLVEMHGGTIKALSEGEAQGATFVIALPITTQQSRAAPESNHAVPLAGISVLIVEDDPDARALIVRILSDAGATVNEAASAEEALALVASRLPDILVSDIGMAKQDGYQLVQLLRSGGYPPERLPAIALTAFSRAQDREQALAAGFQVHLTKPVNTNTLISAVAELVRDKRGT